MKDIERPNVTPSNAAEYGSDVAAQMLRQLDIPYIALNPGASYRGFHDSLVNNLGNETPQMLLCLNEDHVVSIAHGYAKVTDKAMACVLHSNVGLLHGSMGIFNAWCDRAPMIVVGATGPVAPEKRRPWIDWIHTAKDQGALLRDYIKWDDEPRSPHGIVEAFLRGSQLTNSQPTAPVYICLDAGLQEQKLDEPMTVPSTARYLPASPPRARAEDIEAVAELLANAKNPLILFGRGLRNQQSWDNRIKLAELAGASVMTSIRERAAFPSEHKLHVVPPFYWLSPAAKEVVKKADVIVSFDWVDLNGFLLQITRKTDTYPAKIAHCTLDASLHRGWSMDYFALPPVDVPVVAGADGFVEDVLAALDKKLGGKSKWTGDNRNTAPVPVYTDNAEVEMGPRDIEVALAKVRGDQTFTLAHVTIGWAGDVYKFRDPLDFMGHDGGAGLAAGPGLTVGVALALKDQNRPVVSVLGDGDFMQGVSALWTAAHYKIPALFIVSNNRSNFNDELHQEAVAKMRGRPPENRWIGQRIADPELDLCAMARAQGVEAEGPIKTASELEKAIERGLAAVRAGKPYFIEVAKEQLASFQKDLETAQEYAKSLGPDAKSVDTGYDAAIAGVKKYTAEVERLTASLKLSEGAADAAQDRQRSFAQEAAMRTALPDVTQLEALKNQTMTLQGAVEDTRREIANLVPDEATGARLKALTAALDLFNKALDKSQAATRGFKTEFQRLSEGNAIALDAVTAFSPKAKADIAKRQAELTYSQDPNAVKLGQDAYNLSLKQSVVALSEAARARELYARQSEAAAAEEIKMVGQTAGKQAEMRANLQARQALEQQLLQTHEKWGPQQDAEIARLAEINRRYGEQVQLLAKAQINDQIKFDRATIGLSQEDVQIAQQLRSIYPDVATALGSTEAAGMRLNNQLREARDISTGFANNLVSGLLRGDDAMKALGASATSLVSKLASANVTRFMQGGSFFGNQSLASGAGALGMAGAGLAGYQSGNMLTGALGGAMSGATFGPAGMAIGAAAGFLGGLFGGNAQRKEEERKAQQAAQDRTTQYLSRAQASTFDTSTREGNFAAQEAQFQAQRLQEAQNGGQAMKALDEAQNAERLALQQEWDKREIEQAKAKQEAIDARVLSAQDRLFAAMNDNTTLEGQLAAADRQFLRQRLDETKAGGEAINDLVAAQEAERIDIIKKYNDDLLKFVQGVAKTIREYLQSLKTGSNSILSPQAQLGAARANFQAELAKAQSGDRDALSGITQVAQALLDQAKSFYASSDGYADIYGQVTAALQGVADMTSGPVSDNDKLIAAINESKTVTTGTIQTTSLAEQSLLGAINILADRFVDAINGLGQITASIGSGHSVQFGSMISWLAAINKTTGDSGGSFWSWLGFKSGGEIPRYANGGVVGNGTYNVDSVLARYAGGGAIGLAGGEYVMPADQTAQYRPVLDAMRSGSWGGGANDNGQNFAALGNMVARAIAGGSMAQIAANREEMAALRAEIARLSRALEGNRPKAPQAGTRSAA